jgi:4,5-DOPA dioxygenase extradiol
MEALGGCFADQWRRLGETVPRPRAVLMVSAHWFVDETAVTSMLKPRTIHDFYGFPEELFAVQYPASGDPRLAQRITSLLYPLPVKGDLDWGLDHGTWSVLRHLFPHADVPVLQLSIDRTKPPSFHFEVGRRLRDLRDEGVLVAGSGDVVHNLRAVRWQGPVEPYDWAVRFNAMVRDTIAAGDRSSLIDYLALWEDARRSAPTPDHYLPLLYVLGAAYDDEPATFFTDDIVLGSISMLGFALGRPQPGDEQLVGEGPGKALSHGI